MSDRRAQRTFVVGDLHGCNEELEQLLDAIEPTDRDRICFLGDYVDRGPSPRGVIERLLRLSNEGPSCVFLKGNHEDMLLSYLVFEGRYCEAFIVNGGDANIDIYGIGPVEGAAAAERMPPDHLEFLRSLQLSARFGDFLCVHAGVRPSVSLEEQSDEDLLWIREEFIEVEHSFGCVILYGHTPQRTLRVHLPFKLGLDTGLVYGNLLSCFELESKEIIQVRRHTGSIVRRSLRSEFEHVAAQVA
jgi:serine/threonine protein phosphatase 1